MPREDFSLPPSSPLPPSQPTESTAPARNVPNRYDTISHAVEPSSQKTYNLPEDRPILIPPGGAELSPSNDAFRRELIVEYYAEELNSRLDQVVPPLSTKERESVLAYLLHQTPLHMARLEELAKKVGEEAVTATIRAANLSKTWSPSSLDPSVWTPLPAVPYSKEKRDEIEQEYHSWLMTYYRAFTERVQLDAEKNKLLLDAIEQRVAPELLEPELREIYETIQEGALQEVRKAYWLPGDWSLDKAESAWAPHAFGIASPEAIARQQTLRTFEELLAVLEEHRSSGEAILPTLPPGSPQYTSMQDFIAAIIETIGMLKATLQQGRMEELAMQRRVTEQKALAMEERSATAMLWLDKQRELQKAQEPSAFSETMKWLGPVLAIVGGLIAIGSVILTGGASLLLLGTAIAAITMSGYALVDQQLGITEKAMQAVSEFAAAAIPDETVRTIVMGAIAIALVVAMAALLLSGAGAGLAGAIGAQLFKQVALQAIKQIGAQALVIVITSSGAIPKLAGLAASKIGGPEAGRDAELWTSIILMAVILVIGIISSPGGRMFVSDTVQTLGKAKDAVVYATTHLRETATAILQAFGRMPAAMKSGVLSSILAFKELPNTIRFLATSQKGLPLLQATFQLLPMGMNSVDGFLKCSMSIKTSQLLKEVGDLKGAEEEIKGLIQVLQQLLKNLQAGIYNSQEELQALQEFANKTYSAAHQNLRAIFDLRG